jgi:capsule polysaccharide export protein KpsE/RkpR
LDEFKEIAQVIDQKTGSTLLGSIGALYFVWKLLRRERLSYSQDSADIAEANKRATAQRTIEDYFKDLHEEIARLNKSIQAKDSLIDALQNELREVKNSLIDCREVVVKQDGLIKELSNRTKSMNNKFDTIKLRVEDCNYCGEERRKHKRPEVD